MSLPPTWCQSATETDSWYSSMHLPVPELKSWAGGRRCLYSQPRSICRQVHLACDCSDLPNSQTVFEYLYLGNVVCIWKAEKKINELANDVVNKSIDLRARQFRRFVAFPNELIVDEDAILAGAHQIKVMTIVVQDQVLARHEAILADVKVDGRLRWVASNLDDVLADKQNVVLGYEPTDEWLILMIRTGTAFVDCIVIVVERCCCRLWCSGAGRWGDFSLSAQRRRQVLFKCRLVDDGRWRSTAIVSRDRRQRQRVIRSGFSFDHLADHIVDLLLVMLLLNQMIFDDLLVGDRLVVHHNLWIRLSAMIVRIELLKMFRLLFVHHARQVKIVVVSHRLNEAARFRCCYFRTQICSSMWEGSYVARINKIIITGVVVVVPLYVNISRAALTERVRDDDKETKCELFASKSNSTKHDAKFFFFFFTQS